MHDLAKKSGFEKIEIFGINCHSNWNSETSDWPYFVLEKFGDKSPLLRNTLLMLAEK